jgi:succinate dehydrogenase hydrophobic anchor subunit
MKENLTLQSHYDSSHTSYKRKGSRSKQIVRVQQRVSAPLLFLLTISLVFFLIFPLQGKQDESTGNE